MSIDEVTKLEVLQGRGSHVREGIAVGGIAGALIGAAIGVATYEECVPEGWFDCTFTLDEAARAMLAGTAGGVLGAGVGALLGSTVPKQEWLTIPRTSLRVDVAPPRRGGMALGASVAF